MYTGKCDFYIPRKIFKKELIDVTKDQQNFAEESRTKN